MIVCSCNVLSDDDIRAAVSGGAELPRTARQVYGCLGCSAECGRCARTIKRIMTEAFGARRSAVADLRTDNADLGHARDRFARECAANCPHQAHDVRELQAN